jgi:hypothetical protein
MMSSPSPPLSPEATTQDMIRGSPNDLELRTSLSSSSARNGQSVRSEHDSNKTRKMVGGVARHTLGLILLLFVVFLWTPSNFLGSVCISSRDLNFLDKRLTFSDYFRRQNLCQTLLPDVPQHRRIYPHTHPRTHQIGLSKLAERHPSIVSP